MAFESPQRDDVPLEYDEWVETLHSAARGLDTNVTMTLIDEPMQRLLLEAHCTLLKTLLPAPNAVTAATLAYPFAIVRSQFQRLSKFTFGDPNDVIYPNLLGFLPWQKKDCSMARDCCELGLLLDIRNTISMRLGEIHHQYAECNICRNTIIGTRHHGKECEDFEVCTDCVNLGQDMQQVERYTPTSQERELMNVSPKNSLLIDLTVRSIQPS